MIVAYKACQPHPKYLRQAGLQICSAGISRPGGDWAKAGRGMARPLFLQTGGRPLPLGPKTPTPTKRPGNARVCLMIPIALAFHGAANANCHIA